ncbi:MAG: cytoplasmic protein [Kofleriaceae bacterium]
MRSLLLSMLLLTGCGSAPPTARPTSPASPATAGGPDPILTDPDNYRMVMENEHVRVLRYHDVPRTKTHLHHHPASVLYALSAFQRRLTLGNGTTQIKDLKAGDVFWLPAQDHTGENIGTTDTEVLLVEVKEASAGR